MHTSDAAIHLAFVDATFSLSFSLIFCFEPHTHSSIYTRRLSHLLRWQSLDNICALSAQKRSDTLRKKKKLNNYFFPCSRSSCCDLLTVAAAIARTNWKLFFSSFTSDNKRFIINNWIIIVYGVRKRHTLALFQSRWERCQMSCWYSFMVGVWRCLMPLCISF